GMEAAHHEKDYRRVFRLHNEFHEVFLHACGNEQLYHLIRALVMKFQRFRILLAIAGKSENSITQHRDIIQAFRERDVEKASRLVAENAALGREVIIGEILSAMQ
ncbi:MAG: FCD domain-containing protein, partial [Deltaproteobacteria bacterium]|nr:FCD domain-containing protein [Deltaproteobacteria bacterium]